MILGVNDPYIIAGTMGGAGGGSSLPADSAGYLFNDGAGNYSWDAAATPEAAGSTTQIQYNDGGTMGGAAGLLYDKTLIDLSIKDIANDAAAGSLTFLKNRAGTGAAGQDADLLGSIIFKGYNDKATPELITYASIVSSMLDASDGSEDGCMDFNVMCQGTWRRAMRITKDTNDFYGVSIGDPVSPLAALHVDSSSLDFTYAAKIVNTVANRGALHVLGPTSDGYGINVDAHTAIQATCTGMGGATISATMNSNLDGTCLSGSDSGKSQELFRRFLGSWGH